MCLAVEQQRVYISRFSQLLRYFTTCAEMCLFHSRLVLYIFNCFRFYFLLMMDIAKYETFKNFIILNKALLFLIKLNKTAMQSVPKFHYSHKASLR